MTVTILRGDCREVLRSLPAESVHCVVTSPPYWGLRDYGVTGQIGLEASYADYIETLVETFRQAWRALRSDGTVWLNLGDSYANYRVGDRGGMPGQTLHDGDERGKPARPNREKNSTAAADPKMRTRIDRDTLVGNDGAYRANGCARRANRQDGLKEKDLCGIPWRVAFALQSDGWYLRQDIIWSKPNPMPESVRDRCTKAHEYIFLLSKSERYYYDAEAIAEPAIHAGRLVEYDGSHNATRNRRSVWEIATAPYSECHFATFPPALIEPCIKAGCPVGGMVLDPFGGAGTAGLVADRLGRNAILIELNPEYAAMAERRLRNDAGMFASVSLTSANVHEQEP